MITAPERVKVELALAPVLPGAKILSSTLLQAFATFNAMASFDMCYTQPHIAFDYVRKCNSGQGWNYVY